MTSALKYAALLVLFVGLVFAVTYFSRYTPSDPAGPKADAPVGPVVPPLVFATNARRWDPVSPSLPDRLFPGFYPVGDQEHSAAFWFENRNREKVVMQLRAVNCGACSGGRVRVLPADLTRELMRTAATSVALNGLVPGPAAGLFATPMVGPAVQLERALADPAKWTRYNFIDHVKDLSQVKYEVAGTDNPDGWTPRWGILELLFKVKPNPVRPLQADFVSRVEGTDRTGADRFSILYEPAAAVEIDKPKLDAGEVSPGAPEQTVGFVAFSAVDPALPPPALRVEGGPAEGEDHVTAGPPAPLSEAERQAFSAALSLMSGQPYKVAAAYRVPVTVRSAAGGRPADIGRIERTVWVTAGSEVRQVQVSAVVRGPVYLAGAAKEITLPTFASADGGTGVADLVTEKAGTELAVVADQCQPKYLKVDLQKLPDRGEKGAYRLKVTVPKNELVGELRDGLVVLEVKGPTPQRVRLPVVGRASR
ncbi:MAG: hypothetical protein K2X82_00170 [Gemmataceae bacterium]|nr:hypothetical protein [Gemmataceae bacterium]